MYGFDGFFHNNRWGSAGTNIAGIACDPQAAAVVAGIPDISDEVSAELLASENIELPDLGLTVQYNRWANSASRGDWFSFDVVFGASPLDTSAGVASFVLTA